MASITSPLIGTVVAVNCAAGDRVEANKPLIIIESMKMEHVVAVSEPIEVLEVFVSEGDTVAAKDPLLRSAPIHTNPTPEAPPETAPAEPDNTTPTAPDGTAPTAPNAAPPPVPNQASEEGAFFRADVTEVRERHAVGLDEARPEAVTARRKKGRRTTRENIADLVDDGSFVEYGPLVIAAQRRRRSEEDLIAKTPADGMVMGIGTINGAIVPPDRTRCAVMAYDYTVLAGTQGHQNHRKSDRLLAVVAEQKLPLVLFSEGGGGRPGDTDGVGIAGLDVPTFARFAELSGQVPLVGINAGYCFAGNAALLGCCDVIIATEDSSIGMAGPAMIEGGGLGTVEPQNVGPIDVQRANGVVDIVASDEDEAVTIAKQYLSYFQGSTTNAAAPDPNVLRDIVPESRVRVYDMRAAIAGIADVGSVLELQREWAPGIITVLARVEGHPLAIVANNPAHLGGAVDPDGAAKSARFLRMCTNHRLPVLFLCDTPGFMVGPDIEQLAMVRRAGDLYIAGSKLDVPFGTIVTRKGYGLGAMAMAGGGFKETVFTIGWPTSEFGGMGLEGYVRLGYRKEIAAAGDEAAQEAKYRELLARMYAVGKGVSAASHFEIDDVIDPAESRQWVRLLVTATP